MTKHPALDHADPEAQTQAMCHIDDTCALVHARLRQLSTHGYRHTYDHEVIQDLDTAYVRLICIYVEVVDLPRLRHELDRLVDDLVNLNDAPQPNDEAFRTMLATEIITAVTDRADHPPLDLLKQQLVNAVVLRDHDLINELVA